MNDIEFVKVADARTIGFVEALAREIWTEHYTPIIGSAQVAYMLEKYQSAAAVARQIKDEKSAYYLIQEDGGGFIGYIGIVPRQDAGELFLSKVYIHSSRRGKGYARAAVRFVTGIAREMYLGKITLTVNKHNSGTIRAYEKLGFKNTGAVVTDIGGGYVMDDYRMELVLDN